MSSGKRHLALGDLEDEPKRLDPLFALAHPDEIAARIAAVHVVRGVYDVPFLAGYSTDAKTVYIDKRVPARLEIRTRGAKGAEGHRRFVDVVPFLLVHEVTEKTLIDEAKASYTDAHRVATRREREAVERAGLDWADYEDTLDGYIRSTEHEQLHKVPPDLDLKPYAAFGEASTLRAKQTAQWSGT